MMRLWQRWHNSYDHMIWWCYDDIRTSMLRQRKYDMLWGYYDSNVTTTMTRELWYMINYMKMIWKRHYVKNVRTTKIWLYDMTILWQLYYDNGDITVVIIWYYDNEIKATMLYKHWPYVTSSDHISWQRYYDNDVM